MNMPSFDESIKRVGDTAAAVAACAIYAYVSGWALWFGYLSSFDAPWLIGSVTISAILERSALPLSLLFVFLMADVSNVRQVWSYPPGKVGILLCFPVLVGLYLILSNRNGHEVALTAVGLFLAAFLVSVLLADVVQQSAPAGRRLKSFLVLFVIAGFALPVALGFLWAWADRQDQTSSLASIHLKEMAVSGSEPSLRLLLVTDDRVFAIETGSKLGHIKPLTWDQVEYISKPSRR